MIVPPLPDAPLLDEVAASLTAMPEPGGSPYTALLEKELATAFGVPHAVAVSSGTAALHAGLSACGIGAGDEVLVPALTVVMTVAPLAAIGARAVFVDSDPATLDLDYDDAATKLTSRTRAIMPVHLWGRMGDPAALTRFASEHGLTVIEDAAPALGSARDGRRAGTIGAAGCFSMKDGKILWSGEGGFLLTAEEDVAAHAAAWRSHWQPPPPGEAPMSRLATNARLAGPLAALSFANVRRLPDLLARRRAQTEHLLHALRTVPGLTPLEPAAGEQWNGFAPLLHLELPRPRAFAEHLAQRGVPSSTGSFRLVPCDTRPPFAAAAIVPCRGAETVLDHTLALVLTDHDDETVLDHYAATIAREAAAATISSARCARPPPGTRSSAAVPPRAKRCS